MAYITKADLVGAFAGEIAQFERSLSPEAIDRACQDASDIADGYIATNYTVPLATPPTNIKIYVCDIARYLLAKDRPTDAMRARYEDALSYFKLLSQGKVKLQVENAQTGQPETASKAPATMPIGTTYRGGVFGDDVLDRMPSINPNRFW